MPIATIYMTCYIEFVPLKMDCGFLYANHAASTQKQNLTINMEALGMEKDINF